MSPQCADAADERGCDKAEFCKQALSSFLCDDSCIPDAWVSASYFSLYFINGYNPFIPLFSYYWIILILNYLFQYLEVIRSNFLVVSKYCFKNYWIITKEIILNWIRSKYWFHQNFCQAKLCDKKTVKSIVNYPAKS